MPERLREWVLIIKEQQHCGCEGDNTMTDLDFYKVLKEIEPAGDTYVLTVTEGDHIADKCVIKSGKLLAETGSFFAEHSEDIVNCMRSGFISIAGTRVFCEQMKRDIRMILCGGGHVSQSLIAILRMIDCPVTVLEDRQEFADMAIKSGADAICAPFDEALTRIDNDSGTYFVVATRAHQYDQLCLSAITRKNHGYIGLLGSRKRTAALKQLLIDEGADARVVEAIHTPVGLAIGAETPQEIAISIAAEIIQVKNSGNGCNTYPQELLKALTENSGRKALAVIIRKQGSVPRNVGTKMLIRADGTFAGTIGGGYAEAEILRIARQRLAEQKYDPFIFTVSMHGETAEKQGMMCGGSMDVLIAFTE